MPVHAGVQLLQHEEAELHALCLEPLAGEAQQLQRSDCGVCADGW